MQWMYFPSNQKPGTHILDIIKVFNTEFDKINSDLYEYKSDDVLSKVAPHLIALKYNVELSKRKIDRVRVPVLFGENGKEQLAFEADAYSSENRVVIEVEAGRAVTNYQFLKDFFQACMMTEVEYICIAVRRTYKNHKDYKKVCEFFEAMYASNRIIVPLKGVLIIGY